MINKKTNKSRKWLKATLVSATSLSTLAIVPTIVCASNIKYNKQNTTIDSTKDPVLKAGTYVKIIFALSEQDKSEATIEGDTVVKVKKGDPFGTILKPTAKKAGSTFLHWKWVKPDGSEMEMKSDTPCHNDGTLIAVFEKNQGKIIVKSFNDSVAIGEKVEFEAQVFPSTSSQEVEWYTCDHPAMADEPSQYATFEDPNSNILTPIKETESGNYVYVYAVPKGWGRLTDISVRDSNVAIIQVFQPWNHPKYSKTVIANINNGSHSGTYSIDLSQFYSTEGKLYGTKIGGDGSPEEIYEDRSQFNGNIVFGSSITTVKNDFLANYTSFDGTINFNNVNAIGMNFLSGATAFNKPINFSESVVCVGDSFLKGCTNFNSPVTFGSSIWHIGNFFMDGCSNFAYSLVLPQSINNVGNNFLYNCNKFNFIEIHCPIYAFKRSEGSLAGEEAHTIKALCLDDATFEGLTEQLGPETGDVKRTLVEAQNWFVGTPIAMNAKETSSGFVTQDFTIASEDEPIYIKQKDGSHLDVKALIDANTHELDYEFKFCSEEGEGTAKKEFYTVNYKASTNDFWIHAAQGAIRGFNIFAGSYGYLWIKLVKIDDGSIICLSDPIRINIISPF